MASALRPLTHHNATHLLGPNYRNTLNQSLESLLDSETPDPSNLTSIFQELIQCSREPPLEAIWCHSALHFLSTKPPNTEPLAQISSIKDLFELIVTCSVSCPPVRCIVLMAPVIYHLHRIIVNLKGLDLGISSKKVRKFRKESKVLVDSILGYVNICCEGMSDSSYDGLDELLRPFGDLVNIWIDSDNAENQGGKDRLIEFFPLLSADIVDRIANNGSLMDELAGFVIAEAFLLKLCLTLSGKESNFNELRSWVVGSITSLRNPYFFETLLSILLESSLPVNALLGCEDEALLRCVLYDAAILAEYSFLEPEKLASLRAMHVKSIMTTKLLVAHEAIEFSREKEDQTKAISYTKAFSGSSLPSQLVRWIRSQIGAEPGASGPNGHSPKALLRWILSIENLGIKMFDDCLSKYRAKLVFDDSKEDFEPSASKSDRTSETNLVFYIDNKGDGSENDEDEEVHGSTSAAFLAAAHSMQSTEDKRRKRKTKNVKQKQLKFLKHDLYDNSNSLGQRSEVARNNSSSSESEVENPSSDEEL